MNPGSFGPVVVDATGSKQIMFCVWNWKIVVWVALPCGPQYGICFRDAPWHGEFNIWHLLHSGKFHLQPIWIGNRIVLHMQRCKR